MVIPLNWALYSKVYVTVYVKNKHDIIPCSYSTYVTVYPQKPYIVEIHSAAANTAINIICPPGNTWTEQQCDVQRENRAET